MPPPCFVPHRYLSQHRQGACSPPATPFLWNSQNPESLLTCTHLLPLPPKMDEGYMLSPLHVCLLSLSRISQKVKDGFGQNSVERLDVCKGRNYLILVTVRIQIRPYQWDTKHKLFSLTEVCAPPRAILVPLFSCLWNNLHVPFKLILPSRSSRQLFSTTSDHPPSKTMIFSTSVKPPSRPLLNFASVFVMLHPDPFCVPALPQFPA